MACRFTYDNAIAKTMSDQVGWHTARFLVDIYGYSVIVCMVELVAYLPVI